MLTVDNLCVDPIPGTMNWSIVPGDCVAIVGVIASGKSVLLHSLVDRRHRCHGTVRLGETLVGEQGAIHAARQGIAFAPQHGGTFRDLTAEENLRFGWEHGRIRRKRAWRIALAEAVYAFPAIEPTLGRFARDLSGGQQRITSLLRAWIGQPRLLLLDEPVTGLDAANRGQLATLLATYCADGGMAVTSYQFDADVPYATRRLTVAPAAEPAFDDWRTGNDYTS